MQEKGGAMTAPVPISVFQIRAGFENPDLVLPERQDPDLRVEPVRVAGRRVGDLYAKATAPHPPRWLAYLSDHVDVRDLRLRVSSASAVLLVRAGDRLYAITFGHGHTLLAHSAIESSFGLKVTLNAIDESGLRAIDHKRLDAVTRLTREQLDRESVVTDFGLDVERDLLRAVVGKPRDPTLGTRLAGADRIVIFGGPPLAELQAYLTRIGDLASRDDYRRAFPLVDNLREMRDSGAIGHLWDELVELIRHGGNDSVHLTIPEILDWHVVDHFRYATTRGAPQHGDLNLGEYLSERVPDLDDLSSRIEADRVYGWSVDVVEPSKRWSVRRCLTAEIGLENAVFVLSDGKWYEARRDLIVEIEEALRGVDNTRVQLPPYEGGEEDVFNTVARDRSAGLLYLIHQNKVHLERRGSVEPCDLYSSARVFIHAKRYHGASAMSHLFSQGLVSAGLFAQNRLFRGLLNDLLPATHRVPSPERNPAPTDYEIAYVVLGRDGGALGLPFFSRANLRNALRQLTLMGFNVTLTTLPDVSAALPPPRRTPPARRRRPAARTD
jgi:uncharacterized protein (TIGR04141 family)